MLIYSLLFSTLFAQTPLNQESVRSNELLGVQTKGERYQVQGELSLESKNQMLSGQRNKQRPGIQNFALGFSYKIQSNINSYIELLGEQELEDTNVYFGQVFVDYTPELISGLNFSVGNMYYSYGVLTGLEGLLTNRPQYYTDLLVTRRGIDLGAMASYQPLQNLPLSVSYSYFTGTTFRSGDQRVDPAEVDPQFVSLICQPSFLTAKTTYLRRRYKNRPDFTATGLELSSPLVKVWKKRLQGQLLSEYWRLEYQRLDASERFADTYLLGTYLEFFNVYHRFIVSQENWNSVSALAEATQVAFQLNGVGYKVNEYLRFEYQRILGDERQSALQLQSRNEEAWRLFLKF